MKYVILARDDSWNEKPSEEMLTYYYKTVNEHIKLVRESLKYMAKLYPRSTMELNTRASAHDRSRFGKDEYAPSVWVEWIKKKIRDKEPVTYPNKNVLSKAIAAQMLHNATNSHHPEFHHDLKDMGTLDIIEYVCDLEATSKQEGTKLSKAAFTALKKHNWTENQKSLIRRLVKILEHKPAPKPAVSLYSSIPALIAETILSQVNYAKRLPR